MGAGKAGRRGLHRHSRWGVTPRVRGRRGAPPHLVGSQLDTGHLGRRGSATERASQGSPGVLGTQPRDPIMLDLDPLVSPEAVCVSNSYRPVSALRFVPTNGNDLW